MSTRKQFLRYTGNATQPGEGLLHGEVRRQSGAPSRLARSSKTMSIVKGGDSMDRRDFLKTASALGLSVVAINPTAALAQSASLRIST